MRVEDAVAPAVEIAHPVERTVDAKAAKRALAAPAATAATALAARTPAAAVTAGQDVSVARAARYASAEIVLALIAIARRPRWATNSVAAV